MNDGYNDFDLRVECEERFDTTPVKKEFSKIGFGLLIFSGITLLVSIIIQLFVVSADNTLITLLPIIAPIYISPSPTIR